MNVSDIFDTVMNRSDNPGRGKKQCPNCENYVGVRTYQCACGYEFVAKVKKLTQKEQDVIDNQATDEDKLYAIRIGSPGGRLVYAASNRPSVKLTDVTKGTVFDYCELIIYEGIQYGAIYTPAAIKGYIQHQLGYNSEEYGIACSHVDEWYNEKLKVNNENLCCT